MAVFRSTFTFTDEQKAAALDLEPAFENLLRTVNVDEALITALKFNVITHRETFVGLDDTEAGFKTIAPDLGLDLESGVVSLQKPRSKQMRSRKFTECPRPCYLRVGHR